MCISIYVYLCKNFRLDCILLVQTDDHLAGSSIRNAILYKTDIADTPKCARRREENIAWLKECDNEYLSQRIPMNDSLLRYCDSTPLNMWFCPTAILLKQYKYFITKGIGKKSSAMIIPAVYSVPFNFDGILI